MSEYCFHLSVKIRLSMACDAQMIMTLSMKKIVESRNRRGGASLHRNLLVAGVLFKARDALLAEVAAADIHEKPTVDDSTTDVDVDRTSNNDDVQMDFDRTVAETDTSSSLLSSSSSPPPSGVCSRLNGKENVPPSGQHHSSVVVPDQVQPSMDKPRAVKRASRDVDDDHATPCKTTRADTPVERSNSVLTEPDLCVADRDAVTCNTVSDETCRQSCPSTSVSLSPSYRPVVVPYVVRRSSLTCLDTRLTQSPADQTLVRPLLVVQVV